MNAGVRVPVIGTDTGDAGVTHCRGKEEAFCRAARSVAHARVCGAEGLGNDPSYPAPENRTKAAIRALVKPPY